jgi:hypothetical protein
VNGRRANRFAGDDGRAVAEVEGEGPCTVGGRLRPIRSLAARSEAAAEQAAVGQACGV